jgi:hypothetical protein
MANLEALRARNAFLWHGEVMAGDMLYQPAGMWVLERPLEQQRCFGIRASLLPQVPDDSLPSKGLKALLECSGNRGGNKELLFCFGSGAVGNDPGCRLGLFGAQPSELHHVVYSIFMKSLRMTNAANALFVAPAGFFNCVSRIEC